MFKIQNIVIIILLLISNADILKPISNCLDDHVNCSNLQKQKKCIAGYFNIKDQCTLDSHKYNEIQLTDKFQRISSERYSNKYSICKQIDNKNIKMLGLFQNENIQRIVNIKESYSPEFIYFNLIRSQWQPFNDYLTIIISTQNQEITHQISFEYRQPIKEQILCGKQKMMTQKYFIDISNIRFLQMKIHFKGNFIQGLWAIHGLKVISTCNTQCLESNPLYIAQQIANLTINRTKDEASFDEKQIQNQINDQSQLLKDKHVLSFVSL